ncbi:MAG: hypothetical protein BGO68_04800 [Candidatus Amoebophilus sp. 36-38]|nr:MAG: hypothetical protein BGO68_04800 [Candidatus Amoebophilus sp. 36-38]
MSHPDINHTEIGKIIQARGLKGQVIAHLEPDLATLDTIKYIFIKIGTTLVPYGIEEATLQDHRALLKFQGIADKSAALELINKTIWLPQEVLDTIIVVHKTHQDEAPVGYYVTDLHQGKLGIVQRIEQFPMHACLVIDYFNKELLIPHVPTFIQHIDHKNKQLTVQLPPGFLEAVGYK